MKKLFLVDAYALIYRSYYAFLHRPMRNGQGMNTSAVFGFVRFLREIIKKERPEYLGVAFDSRGPTFRHELFPEYKANRQDTPEDIHAAVPQIKKILHAMRIPILEMTGWEADDIIGTISRRACAEGFEVYMVTPDKDFGQLVNECAKIYRQRSSGEGVEILGVEEINARYGISDPRLLIDILALWGDASDNIPGVAGVGEKTACKLVAEHGTAEQILANAHLLTGKLKEKIVAGREQLLMSKRLAEIDINAPVPFEPERLAFEEPDREALVAVFKELGFNSLVKELGGDPSPVRTPKQAALFDRGEEQDLFAAAESNYNNIDNTEHEYTLVSDEAGVREVAAQLAGAKRFCFDTETSGLDPFTSRLVGVSISIKPHRAWYIPWRGEWADILRPLFENPEISKIGQNLKFDIMVLAQAGIAVRGRLIDSMLMHYLLDPESRHGMNHLARTYLDYSPIAIESLIGHGAKQITMDMVAVERVSDYAAEDADVSLRLCQKLWPQVVEQGFESLYCDIEEPLIGVLADMELAGVRIDSEILAESGREMTVRLNELQARIRDMAGDPDLNVNSPIQLGETLFGRMKLDPNPRLTKTKKYRTDEEYLQSLSSGHPIIAAILEYRGIKKLLSTYIEALPTLVNRVTGRVHTSFNQAVTATGRLSSSNPNLQNIPIRTEQGREIRRAFVAADDDHLILSADYSQVELRLMAHLSDDENLLSAFRKGEDVHTDTASRLFGVPMGEVTPDQRRKAKTANFGIIYGISAFGLSQRLGIPRDEAREIIEGYFRSYPGVKEYMQRVVEQARDKGYVSTLFDRKRQLPDIRSSNATVRAFAERNAVNAPIQGSAADIMKLAMIRVWTELKRRGLRSRMILQVHDEIVIDLYKPERDEVAALVVEAMQGAAQLSIPLTVEYGIGRNWLEAH